MYTCELCRAHVFLGQSHYLVKSRLWVLNKRTPHVLYVSWKRKKAKQGEKWKLKRGVCVYIIVVMTSIVDCSAVLWVITSCESDTSTPWTLFTLFSCYSRFLSLYVCRCNYGLPPL